jgi:hypothetical protein
MSVVNAATQSVASLFGTVTTTANTVTRSISTLAAGVDMLDTYVQSARKEQVASAMAAEKDMIHRVEQNFRIKVSQRKRELDMALEADSKLKEHYDDTQADWDAIKTQIEARLNSL